MVRTSRKQSSGQTENRRQYGAMSSENSIVADLDRINLRLSGEAFRAIDAARTVRAGRVSRNTWIAEAIQEKLKRDAFNGDAIHLDRTGNA